MLHRLFEMQVFFYAMLAAGVAELFIMQVITWNRRHKVKNPNGYTVLTGILRKTVWISDTVVLLLFLLALAAVWSGQAPWNRLTRYAVCAGTIWLISAMFYRYLTYSTLLESIGGYMLEVVGSKSKVQEAEKAVMPKTKKEKQVDKVVRGIQETAASGDNRFSHLMTPEEEAVMRDVIREFMA